MVDSVFLFSKIAPFMR